MMKHIQTEPAGQTPLTPARPEHPVPARRQTDGMHWYIAVVTHNTEKACARRLAEWQTCRQHFSPVELQTYVPVQRELHVWPSNGKKRWIDRIICPSFLFVRCTEAVRYAIKAENPFILHFLKDRATRRDGSPVIPFAVISDAQMTAFRQMVGDAESPVTIDARRLKVGSPVRIKTGRLAGLTGYLYRPPRKKSTSFCIQINLLGYARMEIDAAMLEEITEAEI